MSGGPNGISPVARLAEKQKCPTMPTKTKYTSAADAWAAADERSVQAKMTIVPHSCPGCGYFHLTKRTHGPDVLKRDSVAITTRSTPNHPVFAPIPERVEIPREEPVEEMPVILGNRDARMRVLRKWLAANPGIEPTSADVESVIGVKQASVAQYMTEMGYRNTRGRAARWVYEKPEAPEVVPEAPKPIRTEWHDIAIGGLHHMAIGDLIAAMSAAGKAVRIQISDAQRPF